MRLLFVCTFLLVGCRSAGYHPVVLPNTAPGAVVACRNKIDCYEQSTKACKTSPYMVVENEEGMVMHDFYFTGHGMDTFVIQCAQAPTKEDSDANP